ncbi:histidinol-phosphatase [Sandaracinobacteroides saxicola]|uniref:Histidinol-phosphatase n=1 Tax=Sandaracinobacteroides saxicola TaxID=2759707 RepID=A0A7G5IJH1_9SPHN|nr:histidinol-phosphatase [Sandaracinobacteroides saxicola]QMW23513.1 histidinol-phosphatase [Sandaracinobacteroides saxicola]
MTLAADIALAHRLADAAGEAIRPHFRSGTAVIDKDDASPVTVADRAAEAAMRRILSHDRPQDGIVGEEYGVEREGASRQWVLDPIDGTRAFIAGRPLFGTLIALLEDGAPVLGIIDQPIARDRWIGGDGETRLNGAVVRARGCATLGEAYLATTSPDIFFGEGGEAAFRRVWGRARDTIYGGDCLNYALLATGCLDLVMEEGLKLYDWAALVPVVAGAGGVMTDWRGEVLRLGAEGRALAAGDARVHAAAVGAIGL